MKLVSILYSQDYRAGEEDLITFRSFIPSNLIVGLVSDPLTGFEQTTPSFTVYRSDYTTRNAYTRVSFPYRIGPSNQEGD